MKASSTYVIQTVHGIKEKIDLVRLAQLKKQAASKVKPKPKTKS
ncbi:MAG: hypothetical protein AAF958_09260 [Planctomycetota bacterium]